VSTESPTFEAVYDRYFSFVWCTARRMGIPEAQLDDVCQDVFVAIHRQLPSFKGNSAVKTWVFGFVFNVVQMHHRTLRRKSVAHRAKGELVDPDTLIDINGRAQDDFVRRRQAVSALESALESLDEETRAMFILWEFEGMRAQEIAEAMNTPVSTVYARVRTAKRQFSRAIRRMAITEGMQLVVNK
jgi:RNA polymerase sigma-70 factor (ECF subfamily)